MPLVSEMVSHKHNSAWVRALRRQEHGAFAELLASYRPLVVACGRRCGLREQEVEDVVSTTFLQVYQALPSFRGDAALSTWLRRIAYNQSISVLRKSGRTLKGHIDRGPADGQDDPLFRLETQELKDKLDDALKYLPPQWIEAITLRYWNHMSIAQIAQVMQVSDVAVRSYLFRARKRLRLVLES